MQKSDFIKNFKKVIKLIPDIQTAVSESVKQDLKSHEHTPQRLNIERKFLSDGLIILQKKWLVDILYILQFLKNPYFNEIKRAIPGIGSKILTDRLNYLQKKNIVERNVLIEKPIRVSYELTDFGDGLFKLLLPFILYFVIPKHQFESIKEKNR